jgi:hypothetical protein
MKRKDVNNALKARLANGGTGLAETMPAVDPQGAVDRPYFEVLFPDQFRTGPMLSADVIEETGIMSVVIVVEFGVGEDAANDFADAISDLFPQALDIAITGGLITIEQPADIRGGFRDKNDWRVPVLVSYSARNS